ncbi:MAG: TIR domain-containing protein [Saprospiraceae bacterium]
MTKPKIFIGSSAEGLTVAYAVQQNLTHDAEITVWDQGVFELSQTSIESLVSILEKSDFAIFVFSPDDITKIRKKEFLTVRDNVIFELGLFIGKLGRTRTFIVMPDKPLFHIPSDLLGITPGKYDASRSDGSYQAATGPVSHQIRVQINRLGPIQNNSHEIVAQKMIPEVPVDEDQKKTNWWSLYLRENYIEALDLIQNQIKETTEKDKIDELVVWRQYIEYKIDPIIAKNSIAEIINDEPYNKIYFIGLSRIMMWENEFEIAIKIIEKGLLEFNKDEKLILRKCEYLEMLGKFDQAIIFLSQQNYEKSQTLSIKLAELYENLEDKKLDEAFKVILSAYKNNKSSEQLAIKLAKLSHECGRNQIALYLLDDLTNKYPTKVDYWCYLGNSCLSLELNNKAMITYKKAEDLSNPKESWILENIGNLLNNQGFYSEARKYFDQALMINANSTYSFDRVSSIIKNEEKEEEKYSKYLIEGLNSITNQNN